MRPINHVLRSAPMALERLRRHAGRTAAFHLGPMTIALTVQTTGEVEPAVAGAARDLDVWISPLREMKMEGDMALGEDVRYLARNLTWDYEEDLSHVVGDIAAHRIASAARGFRAWSRDSAVRLAQGAAEYWTEESPLIASRVKVEGFIHDVAQLREAVDRLEKRIGRLG